MASTALNSPFFRQPASVQSVMLRVLAALLPGVLAYVYFFGEAILIQLTLASVTALLGEALALLLRRRPLWLFLSDGSALVTAWLIALSLPPLVPWWLTVTATLIAILIVKHLYGGLGQNIFNPAMAAFCVMIVAWPQWMSQWPAVWASANAPDLAASLQAIFGALAERQVDAIVSATPLDHLRTALSAAHSQATVASVLADGRVYGEVGGMGWEWVCAGYLLGGLWLIQQRIITWHIPAGFIVTLALIAGISQSLNPAHYAGPLFHLFSGAALLGAFFIATDPVSAATTPLGKLIFGAGIALMTWIIRQYGAYPDGVAFATLLMNLCAPLIDLATQRTVFGHGNKPDERP